MKNILEKLFGPTATSIFGKINWKEVGISAFLGVIFLTGGGNINTLIKFLLENVNINPDNSASVLSGLEAVLLSYFHRIYQGSTTNVTIKHTKDNYL